MTSADGLDEFRVTTARNCGICIVLPTLSPAQRDRLERALATKPYADDRITDMEIVEWLRKQGHVVNYWKVRYHRAGHGRCAPWTPCSPVAGKRWRHGAAVAAAKRWTPRASPMT